MFNNSNINTIGSYKPEKLHFIIELNKNLYEDFFVDFNNSNYSIKDKFKRLDIIVKEIQSFVRLNGYVSCTENYFSLYCLGDKIIKLIDLSVAEEFINNFDSAVENLRNIINEDIIKNSNINLSDKCNLSQILNVIDLESINYIYSNNLVNEETIDRIVLFYNSNKEAVFEDVKYKNILGNNLNSFVFDIIYIHDKITSTSNSDIVNDIKKTYNSLVSFKCNKWYCFENSGNLQEFKHLILLLISCSNQRLSQVDLIKKQSLINDMYRNFSSDINC